MHVVSRLLAGALVLSAAATAAAASFSDVYFFGDSLTDTGNVTVLYASVPKPPGAPAVVPGPPYDAGGRASNGPVYADVLAAGLGHGADATASLLGGNNFAFGGARTRYQLFGPPFPGINQQVSSFVARPGPADAQALYVLWAGSNNLQDIFLGRTTDALGAPIPNVAASLGDVGSLIDALYADGARHLLVPNVSNLGLVPRVSQFGPGAQAAATGLVQAYNAGLTQLLDGLAATHPGLDLIRFDSFSFLNQLVANASALGFSNTTDRCYTGDDTSFTGGGSVCADPDQYVFWDGIHPTSHTHRLVGEAMLDAVVAVPEPSAAVLMLVGLGAAGLPRVRRGLRQV
jgi:phospholipase/lecithinase/hemolysin